MEKISRTSLAFLVAICLGLISCGESSKGQRAAVQYAFSCTQVVKFLGFGSMSDLREVEKQSRGMDREREGLRADASERAQEEARQLDALILYVAKCLDQNIRDNAARPEAEAAAGPLPVVFPNAAYNQLLGLDPKNGDDSAQRSLTALHAAIHRFAEKVGVDGDFKDALQRRAESDAAQSSRKPAAPEKTWKQVREEKLGIMRAKKAALIAERGQVEKQALEAKAPVGFGPARWLMYQEEVKKVCPNATPDSEGNLEEKMQWLDRPVKVEYKFENGFLVNIMVSFEDPGTKATFSATQQFLQGTYKMSNPKPMETLALTSTYSTGILKPHLIRFTIFHALGNTASGLELVIYSREDL